MKSHVIQVNSYSGYKADERPLNFTFKSKKYSIKDIIYQTYEENIPEGRRRTYTVETVEGQTFELCYNESQDKWLLEGV